MMNEFQRRVLAEAAKYGGVAISKNDQMAKIMNEAPAISPSAVTSMFGYSKQQFEAKIRQLLQKMGFERGITRMVAKPNGNMVLYFANKVKARDFAMTFQGMTRRMSGGSNIVQFTTGADMTPDQKKLATGAEAMVELMLNKLKKESLDNESYIFMALENLYEEYFNESAVKRAIEDFMYDGLPKAAIAELKTVMKKKGSVAQQVMRLASITAILNKHGVAKKFMGFNTANLVNDYFDTFHGESLEVDGEETQFVENDGSVEVEEAYAHPDEKVLGRFYEKTGKQAFEYRISQDSWGKSHGYPHEVCVSRKDYKGKGDWRAANVKGTVCYIVTDEGEGGKPVVEKWAITKHIKYVKAEGFEADIDVLDEKNWGGGFETSREAQAKVQAGLKADAKKRQSLILSALQQVNKGKMSKPAFKKLIGSSFEDIMSMPFYSKRVKTKKEEVVEDGEIEEEIEVSEQFKAGDKVKVPHKGKMVKGKIVGFDNGGSDKARQHGGGYVVDVGEYASITVPAHKVQKEEVEVVEDYKAVLKGVRMVKLNKPVAFANLEVGPVYTLMYDTSYMGEPMYRMSAPGRKPSGRISGKKIAKAIKDNLMVVAEGAVDDVVEGFAQPTQKELMASIRWLESILKDPKKLKSSGMSAQDAKDNLAAARDMMDFGKKYGSKVNEDVGDSADEISEGVRIMTGVETMIKNVGGASMVSNFRKIKSQFGAKPVGSVIALITENDPESHEIKVYDPKDFQNMVKGLTKKIDAKVGSKGSWSDGEVTVIGIKTVGG